MVKGEIFISKSKTVISFTCLITELLGYVKLSGISRCSVFAIFLATISPVKFNVNSCFVNSVAFSDIA